MKRSRPRPPEVPVVEHGEQRSPGDRKRGKPGLLARETLAIHNPQSPAEWDAARAALKAFFGDGHPVLQALAEGEAWATEVLRAAGLPCTWPACATGKKGAPFSTVEAAQKVMLWSRAVRAGLAAIADPGARRAALELMFQFGHVLQAVHTAQLAEQEPMLLAGLATRTGGRKGAEKTHGTILPDAELQRRLDLATQDWHAKHPGARPTLEDLRRHAEKFFDAPYRRLRDQRMRPTSM